MKGVRKWVVSMFYFIPVIWFMYVSVELLAERSSSMAAMELAYRLHQQQNHNKGTIHQDILPAEQLLSAGFRDEHADKDSEVDHLEQELAAMKFQFQDKLKRYRDHKARMDGGGGGEGQTDLGIVNEVREDSHVLLKDKVPDEQDDDVQFPQYVEAWAPNLPGEEGQPVVINVSTLTAEEKRKYNEGWAHNSFNQYASDLISVHRSLPDNNPEECHEQRKEYSKKMPDVSVIIIFHNEAWSVLLRSVHSVLSRTPAHLLRQIILVDDLSTMDHLKKPLDVYWRRAPKVKIVRAPRRVGLTQARLLGYRAATANVLVFLDSHIECFPEWVQPLIYRVQEEPSTIVFPQIDIIHAGNLRVVQNKYVNTRGVFRWRDLTFQWGYLDTTKQMNRNRTIPVRILQSPISTTVFPMTETINDNNLATRETPNIMSRGIFHWKDLNFSWEFLPMYERKRRKSRADPIRLGRAHGAQNPARPAGDGIPKRGGHSRRNPGRWIEPLLDRIVRNPGAVPYPDIEIIYDDTLRVGITDPGSRAAFRWKDVTFQWEFLPQYEKDRRKNKADYIRSPTMPGGLFAISREFFERLGTYDPGLEYWGGENIELSFKAWMCNGSVELIPCSHVGHIFRKSNPIKWSSNLGNKNSVRVAEVWMDDYKNYFYERINYNLGNYGDVSERKKLRESLGCHSFDWYLKNVYPNMIIPRNMKFAGEVKNVASPQCLDSMGGLGLPRLHPCHSMGGNQFWYFTADGEMYQDGNRICEKDGDLTQMGICFGKQWEYREDRTLQHIQTGKCLAASPGSPDLSLQPCNDSAWLKWTMTTRPADRVFP